MKLMTLKQYRKMSKTALMRKITKTLRAMPKAKLARLCYNLTKSRLPRLSLMKQRKQEREKKLDRKFGKKRIKLYPLPKRKFSRKQLAAQKLFAKRARAGTLKRRKR